MTIPDENRERLDTDARLTPLADAIEEALSKWRAPIPCQYAKCGRDDCPRHQNHEVAGPCRARSEFIAAKISGAAVLYASHGRDPQERIDELLRSNNELLERAREAERLSSELAEILEGQGK